MRRRSSDKNWRPKTWVCNTWNSKDTTELAASAADGNEMIKQLSKAYFIFELELELDLEGGKIFWSENLFDRDFLLRAPSPKSSTLWCVSRVSISSLCVWSSRIRVRSISGLVVKFLLAMQEPRVRFPADACFFGIYMQSNGWIRFIFCSHEW